MAALLEYDVQASGRGLLGAESGHGERWQNSTDSLSPEYYLLITASTLWISRGICFCPVLGPIDPMEAAIQHDATPDTRGLVPGILLQKWKPKACSLSSCGPLCLVFAVAAALESVVAAHGGV